VHYADTDYLSADCADYRRLFFKKTYQKDKPSQPLGKLIQRVVFFNLRLSYLKSA
jgi:hypothetical protein